MNYWSYKPHSNYLKYIAGPVIYPYWRNFYYYWSLYGQICYRELDSSDSSSYSAIDTMVKRFTGNSNYQSKYNFVVNWIDIEPPNYYRYYYYYYYYYYSYYYQNFNYYYSIREVS